MAAFGESCHRCGHAGASLYDPQRRSPANFCCVAKLLFDYLVGGGQERFREGDAERLGGLEIDDQLDLCDLLYREVRGFFALENAAGVNTDLAVRIKTVRSIAHKTAG